MLPTDPIHPLKDVWLRPRRVFRELAARRVGLADCLLVSAQGIGNFLALYRTQDAGAHESVALILAHSIAYGAVAGIASVWLMAFIYQRLGARAGGRSTIGQVIHVLAYGGAPMVASLAIWVLTALLAGEDTFLHTPRAGLEAFLGLLLHMQFISYVFLLIWSIVLQVMGLSEVHGLTTRRAFGVWVLGQLIGLLASLFLAVAIQVLFPGILLRFIPQR